MFYRRKILLALLEAFDGSLKRTDCQKLLFLFCQRRGKNYYDFFPYKYGSFSFVLHQDKNRLTDLGILVEQDIFQLKEGVSFTKDISAQDYQVLEALIKEIGTLRGEKLIRKVYLEFPYFASRSNIVSKVLDQDDHEQISRGWNTDSSPCLFSIGYEGLSIDAYLNVLLSNNISVLIDVRKNPISMKYGFSKSKFADYLQKVGVLYFHFPELGIPSYLRQNLKTPAAYRKLFDLYSSYILPEQSIAIEKIKSILSEYKRVAITCFEADYRFCHRHKIIEYLSSNPDFDTSIVHLNKSCTNGSRLTYTTGKPSTNQLWN